MSVSDAIRLLLLRVADEKRLPFTVQVPDAETVEAMKELDEGKGRRFGSAEELFKTSALEVTPVRSTRFKRDVRRPGPGGNRPVSAPGGYRSVTSSDRGGC